MTGKQSFSRDVFVELAELSNMVCILKHMVMHSLHYGYLIDSLGMVCNGALLSISLSSG